MFTKLIRLAFYFLVATQFVVLSVAFYWERNGWPESLERGITSLGMWFYWLLSAWMVIFLLTVAGVIRRDAVPKDQAMLFMIVLFAQGAVLHYSS
ncbi:MAG: hypothetical protein NUV80_05350 [Candidatus Berkelbacteria bacterium]|nr:hypothetical protein [Candidatus Berkelbacteria bacterium]